TLQGWKALGVFAFERLGGGHLLVALNKDPNTSRTITVQTGIPPHADLQDFAGHGQAVRTDARSAVTLTVPRNANGLGYVCYARPAHVGPFDVKRLSVTQDYEGAGDLDIKPAVENERVTVCRVFTAAHQTVEGHLFFDTSGWTSDTIIHLGLQDPAGAQVAQHDYNRATPQGTALTFAAQRQGFHTFHIQSANTPAQNKMPTYKLRVKYTAPQHS